MRWRLADVVDIGIRAAISDRARTMLVGTLTGVLCAGAVSGTLRTASDVSAAEQRMVLAGRDLLVFGAEGEFDALTCERMLDIPGVRAAGSLTPLDLDVWTTDTATRVTRAWMSPGYRRLHAIYGADGQGAADSGDGVDGVGGGDGVGGTHVPTGDVYIGSAFANDFRLRPGATLNLQTAGRTVVAGVVADTTRAETIAGWVIDVRPPTGGAKECWVDAEPAAVDTLSSVGRALLPLGQKVEVTRLNPVGEFGRDLANEIRRRPATIAGPFVLIGLAVVAGIMALMRRGEVALYVTLGLRRSQIVVAVWVETLISVGIGALVGVTAGMVAATPLVTRTNRSMVPRALLLAFQDAAWAPLAALFTFPITCALASRNVINALKDR